MNKDKIIFPWKDKDKLELQISEPLDTMTCCSRGTIIFHIDNIKYKFSISDVQGHMECFRDTLRKSLAGNCKLHKSITQNIGYLWNEAYRDKPGFVYEGKENEVKLWVGETFRKWVSGKKGIERFSSWIYNDKNDSIILEITPDYPWYDSDTTTYKNYVPYEEWIKSYKPLVIKTIPHEVARQWLEQAEYIVNKIGENIERMQQEIADEKSCH
jgi:hypothetical protein